MDYELNEQVLMELDQVNYDMLLDLDTDEEETAYIQSITEDY